MKLRLLIKQETKHGLNQNKRSVYSKSEYKHKTLIFAYIHIPEYTIGVTFVRKASGKFEET